MSSISSVALETNTGSTATWASVLPLQYQSRSCPPGPQPRRSYSAIVTSVYAVSSWRVTSRNVRRIGSCQHTSGLVSTKCTSSRIARWCRAQP